MNINYLIKTTELQLYCIHLGELLSVYSMLVMTGAPGISPVDIMSQSNQAASGS